MLSRYPGSLRWRQALPPLFVLGLVVLLIAALFLPAARWLLLIVLAIYGMALMVSGLDISLQNKRVSQMLGVPLVIATMHISWGSAFIYSTVQQLFTKRSAA